MTRVAIANLKGPQGRDGVQGLPGTGAVPADSAVAGYIGTGGTSASKTAATGLFQQLLTDTVFNVLHFGAVRDIAADSASAIQAAVDAAVAAGGGTVLIPPGDYGFNGRVQITGSNITISGYGATLHRMTTVGDVFQNWATGDTTTTGNNGSSSITILGLTIDQHGDTLTGESNVVTFDHCRDIIIRDCRFLRTRGFHSLELNGVDGAMVDNCQFLGYDPGTQTGKEAIQLDAALAPADSGMPDETVAKNITVRDCVFGGYAGMGAHTIGVGSHSHASVELYSNITVTGCVFTSLLTRAVVAYWWQDSVVSDCRITNATSGQGVRVESSLRVKVSGIGVTGGGIGITVLGVSKDCIVIGCLVIGGSVGIYDGVSNENTLISSNAVRYTTSYAIQIDGGIRALVTSNRILGAGYTSGTPGSIRCGSNAVGPSIVGNQVRPHGAGTEAAGAVSIDVGVTDAWAFGNDFRGMPAAIWGTCNTDSNRI